MAQIPKARLIAARGLRIACGRDTLQGALYGPRAQAYDVGISAELELKLQEHKVA